MAGGAQGRRTGVTVRAAVDEPTDVKSPGAEPQLHAPGPDRDHGC